MANKNEFTVQIFLDNWPIKLHKQYNDVQGNNNVARSRNNCGNTTIDSVSVIHVTVSYITILSAAQQCLMA